MGSVSRENEQQSGKDRRILAGMTESATRQSRVHLATERPRIPDNELKSFIVGVEARLGMGGTFRDGFVTAGTPDTCPYTDNQLGYGIKGGGTISADREMYAAWHAMGARHRGMAAAFYHPLSETDLNRIECLTAIPDKLRAKTKAAGDYSGVVFALGMAGEDHTLRAAKQAVECAHTAWAIELSNAEGAADAQLRTGAL
jgi:hypothetical protein